MERLAVSRPALPLSTLRSHARGRISRWRFCWKRVGCGGEGAETEKQTVSIFGSHSDTSSVMETPEGSMMDRGIKVGHVVGVSDGVVMIEGLSSEVPIGTHIEFQDGQTGILLWRHSVDVCFALLVSDRVPVPGDTVRGLSEQNSIPEYRPFRIATSSDLKGKVIYDVLNTVTQKGHCTPLLNKELDMASRQPIYQPLPVQHKGIDVLTPIGRGQCILLVSEDQSELTSLANHLIAAQDPSLFCIYACVGKPKEETDRIERRFRGSDLLHNCAFVKASDHAPLAQRYAAMCAALSIGEHIREQGGDALVVLDTIQPLVEMWNLMQKSYSTHRAPSDMSAREDRNEDALVDFNGTLMASKTAERRRFFSSVLQRAAQASEALGGGTMTVVPVVHGFPASGIQHQEIDSKLKAIDQDPKLSEFLKQKLRAKISKTSVNASTTASTNSVPTFIVEEFMSIADGQIVIEEVSEKGVSIDPLLSVSRIGARAYPPALENLAANVRLRLAQAADAVRYGSASDNAASDTWNQKVEILKQSLIQPSGDLCPLSHQVVLLMALETDRFKEKARSKLANLIDIFTKQHPELLQKIDKTRRLDKPLHSRILEILHTL